jgi:hypothetical protein
MGDNRALNIVFRAMAALAAHGVLLGWRSPRVALGSVNCYCNIACIYAIHTVVVGAFPSAAVSLFAALAYQALRFISRN